MHSPTSVRTIPRFPIRASTIIDVKCNCTGSPQTNSHTHTHPVVSSRMPCTPLRVCAPSPASQSGLAPSSMLSATVLVHRKPTCTQTHTPCGQLKDAVHSPTSVRTIPRFPIQASTIIDVKCNCTGSPHTNSHTHTLWSAQGLVQCTPTCTPPPMSRCTIPCFTIWASTISDVQLN